MIKDTSLNYNHKRGSNYDEYLINSSITILDGNFEIKKNIIAKTH